MQRNHTGGLHGRVSEASPSVRGLEAGAAEDLGIEVVWGDLGVAEQRSTADRPLETSRRWGGPGAEAYPAPREGTDDPGDLDDPKEYQRQLGMRLRAVRRARGMRLQDVEEATNGDVKAAVIGSYERGDRSVAAHRLAGLADLYGVPLVHLLPGDQRSPARRQDVGLRLAIDRLWATDDPDTVPVRRLAEHIQQLRGDYGVRVLSLRADDLVTLAAATGRHPDDLVDWLRDLGLLSR